MYHIYYDSRGPTSASSGGFGGGNTSFNPINTSDKGLMQRQQEVMGLQDEMLLDISKGVDRLYIQVAIVFMPSYIISNCVVNVAGERHRRRD
jgi:hypothetical protein